MKKKIITIAVIVAFLALVCFLLISNLNHIENDIKTSAIKQGTTGIVQSSITGATTKKGVTSSTKSKATTIHTTGVKTDNVISIPFQVKLYRSNEVSALEDNAVIKDIRKQIQRWSNSEMELKKAVLSQYLTDHIMTTLNAVEFIYSKQQSIKINIGNKISTIQYTRILIPATGEYKNTMFFYLNDKYAYGPYISTAITSSDDTINELIKKAK